MDLTSVSLPARDLDAVAAFYGDVLGLEVTSSVDAVKVRIGTSRLELRRTEVVPAAHHLAFTIPTGTFADAKTWLRDRVDLCSDDDGHDEFETSPGWNARSVYFAGPEDSVLELIERRDLAHATGGSFSAADLLTISEVGIAVPDVRATAGHLQRAAGIDPYGDEPGADFAAVGDVHGLLILVAPGRTWFPTADRYAGVAATLVEAVGHRTGDYALTGTSRLRLARRPDPGAVDR